MLTIETIKAHYRFSEDDARLLWTLQELAQTHHERVMDELYDVFLGAPDIAAMLQEPATLEKLRQAHDRWFLQLFTGRYDHRFQQELQQFGLLHVRLGLDAHHVNLAMHRVRQSVVRLLQEQYPEAAERRPRLAALEKLLDLCLDVMSLAYREEERQREFINYRFESKLVHAVERFTYGLNLVLVVALVGLSLSVVGLFVWEITHVFSGAIEKGIMSALGTLLILWMMVELMDNEIRTLKGARFNMLVFIGVVIVAIIREILISTLRHDPLTTQAYLAGTLLILGVVYFLVSKSQSYQRRDNGRP